MDNYNKIKNILENNKCSILTTFEEFELRKNSTTKKSYHHTRVDFIGLCGHNTYAIVTNFINRKTGIICKDCTKDKTKNTLKNSIHDTNETECIGINIVTNYLSDKYDIIRTKEGCKADLIINKKGDKHYIPIQIKTTKKISHNMYSFRCINKNYDNMLFICVSIDDEKIWIIPYSHIAQLKSINISMKSKYNKYLVEDNNLIHKNIEIYEKDYIINNIEELQIPISILQKREQEYSKKREIIINFLEYTYPDIQNTPTDFIINEKRIQEKVAGYFKGKNNVLIIYLSSNNGKNTNGNRKFRTYRLGENDYYWFHSSIDDRFWIIPECILYERGYISQSDETINRKRIYICKNTEWIKDYEYDYNNINKDKIYKLFI
jgi:hypothetical protein